MASRKLKLAQGLVIAGLALILIDVFGEGIMPSQMRGAIFAPSGIMLSIAAFAVAPRQKSILVSALLVANGAILAIDGLAGTRNLTVVYFPGPAMGFIFGVIVLARGISKSAMTARSLINLK